MCERGKDGVMSMCTHVYDVALCSNAVKNVVLGLWLVGHLTWNTQMAAEMSEYKCGAYKIICDQTKCKTCDGACAR